MTWVDGDLLTPANLNNKASGNITPEDYGAVGDGVANDTAALQAAFTALPTGKKLLISGTYKTTTELSLSGKTAVTIWGKGTINMTGAGLNDAVIRPYNCNKLEICDLTLTGDNNSDASYGQQGIGGTNGTCSGLHYHGLKVSGVNVGISASSTGAGVIDDIAIHDNTVTDIVGTSTGQGYGIHVQPASAQTTPTNARVFSNTVTRAQRHSIYVTQVNGASVFGNIIYRHRYGQTPGAILPAIPVTRGSNVSVFGNIFVECGGSIGVDINAGFSTHNITVVGNTVYSPKDIPAFYIGDQTPSVEGVVTDITFASNRVYVDESNGDYGADVLRIFSGKKLLISGNAFEHLNRTGTGQFITIAGSDESGATATYTDDITIIGNKFNGTNNGGVSRGVLLQSAAATSIIAIKAAMNDFEPTDAFWAFGTTQTNPNITALFTPQTGLLTTATLVPTSITGSIDARQQNSFFGSTKGFIYTQNDELNFYYSSNAKNEGLINYSGYNGSNAQFRDLGIYNGKHTRIVFVDGTNSRLGINTASPGSALAVKTLPAYANNTAAIGGGLTAGDFYRTNGDPDTVCVVH